MAFDDKLSLYLDTINNKSKRLSKKDVSDTYPLFVVTNTLSYFKDTIFQANQMNCVDWITPYAHYRTAFGLIPKRKRFSKWHKKMKQEDNQEIEKLSLRYDVSVSEIKKSMGEFV
jgi:hypothetical protein